MLGLAAEALAAEHRAGQAPRAPAGRPAKRRGAGRERAVVIMLTRPGVTIARPARCAESAASTTESTGSQANEGMKLSLMPATCWNSVLTGPGQRQVPVTP